MYQSLFKAFFDFILAIILLPFFLVLLLPIFLVQWYYVGMIPIFYQERIGFNNKKFLLYKLKTMSDEKNNLGELLPDNLRITKIGKIIRKYSLDEIPQIFNIFKGDLSFIGPRPLLVQYLPLYNEFQKRRHEVKPGISGWAQVNGRNAISWEQKFEYDVWYVDNQSFWLDLKILFLTISTVLKSKDVNKSESLTMEYFTGNE